MRRYLLAVPMLLLASACGGAPPVHEQLDTLRSWTATATLAAQERSRGAINAAVVTQLHERGVKALEQSEGQLPHDSISAVVADSLRQALIRLDRAGRS